MTDECPPGEWADIPPPALVADLDQRADKFNTPTGHGDMVWRTWGSGPIVLLLHGGYGSWTHWSRNIETIAQRYSVLAPDLPGLGDSAMPPQPYDAYSIARILAQGIDRIIGPAEPFHLVGFSFGGALSGVLATESQERVRSVTLIGPSGLIRLRSPVALRSWRHLPPDEQWAVHRDNLAALMLADTAKIDETAIAIQAANARRARRKSRPIARTAVLHDVLSTIPTSVAAIYGRSDQSVQPHLEVRVAELTTLRPDMEVRLIDGAGHWVQFEAAVQFNETLLGIVGAANGEIGSHRHRFG